jgi:hypothetical protein
MQRCALKKIRKRRGEKERRRIGQEGEVEK